MSGFRSALLACVALGSGALYAFASGCFYSVADLATAGEARPDSAGDGGSDSSNSSPTAHEAVLLASDQATPWSIAVDGTHAYWTNNVAVSGTVVACPLAGCGNTPFVLGVDQSRPVALALDDANVFWLAQGAQGTGEVRVRPKDGGLDAPVVLVSGLDSPSKLAFTGGRLIWSVPTERSTSLEYCNLGTNHRQCDKTWGFNNTASYSPELHAVRGIAVDDTRAFWAEDVAAGRVGSCSLGEYPDCLPIVILATGQDHPTSIAVDATHAYWTNGGNGTVASVAKASGADAGAPNVIARDQATPTGIAVDSSKVFWTNFGTQANGFSDGSVMMADKNGAHAVTIASAQRAPFGITVDTAYVYWTNSGDGTVWKAPR